MQGHDGIAFALPTYLTCRRSRELSGLAEKAKLKIRGTVDGPARPGRRTGHALPVRPGRTRPARRRGRAERSRRTTVLIVDADDYALTASVVRIAEEEVRSLGSATSPGSGVRLWRERLLDALADRCVRLCRRDPRDSADAEQMLFDQIEDAIDRAGPGSGCR